MKVIVDRTQRVNAYTIPSGTYGINAVEDTDGDPGGEIVIALVGKLMVIQPATGRVTYYPIPNATYGINSIAETNGSVGKEIVIALVGAIRIIDDRQRTWRNYVTPPRGR